MRVLYLDEAGIGNIKHDPVLVVAGVLIHADTQWGAIADRLRGLLDGAVPKGQPTPRYLHAKDIFHGAGEFPRKTWPQAVRNRLLHDVACIPREFDIPVVWSALDRRQYAREHPEDPPHERVRDCYSVCTLACLMQTEVYMRELPNQGEVASVVLEQNHELQKRIPSLLEFMKNPDDGMGLLPHWRECLPFTKIIDTPACQPKTASSILQLADLCVFAIKRLFQRSAGATRLTGPFAPQLLRFREASETNGGALWNPRFMPRQWGHKVIFDGTRFVAKD